ncbi:MAG: hypothetical protein KUG77_06140 [Nannocystaceae bacterium]|nr:hypothetical protein [Nannocystaceae bacterium]
MDLMQRAAAPCLAVMLSVGCGGPDSAGDGTDSGTEAEAGSESASGGGTNPSTNATSEGGPTGGASADETTDPTSDPTDDPTAGASDCDFSEDFEGVADGDPWPATWVPVGGVAVADVQDGWGRLRPELSGYSLGRMVTFIDCAEIDTSLTFMFTDQSTQGVGLYARQNGGHLRQTDPVGEGYAAFAESFRDPAGIGAWREVEGQEQRIDNTERFEIQANVEYRMRFRLTQVDDATSLLQGKIWPLAEAEPDGWTVERTDGTASLQGASGALAIDAWALDASQGNEAADLLVDDIVSTAAG